MEPEPGKRCCYNCVDWQDLDEIIIACISTGHSDTHRDKIQLRPCTFKPHPSADHQYIYTDSLYGCGEFKFAKGKDK